MTKSIEVINVNAHYSNTSHLEKNPKKSEPNITPKMLKNLREYVENAKPISDKSIKILYPSGGS